MVCAVSAPSSGDADVTTWRRHPDEDCDALDSRVEGAIMDLNDAIESNNLVEAAATAAAAALEERQQLSRAQLVQLRRKHGPQLRIISRFREAKAMAEAALEAKLRTAAALETASEHERCASEALRLHGVSEEEERPPAMRSLVEVRIWLRESPRGGFKASKRGGQLKTKQRSILGEVQPEARALYRALLSVILPHPCPAPALVQGSERSCMQGSIASHYKEQKGREQSCMQGSIASHRKEETGREQSAARQLAVHRLQKQRCCFREDVLRLREAEKAKRIEVHFAHMPLQFSYRCGCICVYMTGFFCSHVHKQAHALDFERMQKRLQGLALKLGDATTKAMPFLDLQVSRTPFLSCVTPPNLPIDPFLSHSFLPVFLFR